jgi:hypothetical protein
MKKVSVFAQAKSVGFLLNVPVEMPSLVTTD